MRWFIITLLAVNCATAPVVTSDAVPSQIETILQTDVEDLPEGPQKERIKATLETAKREVERLSKGIENSEKKREKAEQTIVDNATKGPLEIIAQIMLYVVTAIGGIGIIYLVNRFMPKD